MKCELCGETYLLDPEYEGCYEHPHNTGCMLEVLDCASAGEIESINSAIQQAREQAYEKGGETGMEIAKILTADQIGIIPVIHHLMEFLQKAIDAETPMMTEFGIQQKEDGKTVAALRVWASHGQTPVDRVNELIGQLKASEARVAELKARQERRPEDDIFCPRCGREVKE